MVLININYTKPPSDVMSFTNIIKFEFDDGYTMYDETDINDLNKVAEWISYNFSENFALIESTDNMIAGGAWDNEAAWKSQGKTIKRDTRVVTAKYELRCYESDAALFMLKWA